MSLKSLTKFLPIIIVLHWMSFSQGLYLKKGESGFGVATSFQKGIFGSDFRFLRDSRGVEISPSYSFKGWVDVSARYSKLYPDGKNGFGGGLAIHPFKQNDKMPVTLSIGAIYELVFFKPESDEGFLKLGIGSHQVAFYSLIAAKHFELEKGLFLIPAISYDHDFMRIDWRANIGLDLQKEIAKNLSVIPRVGFGIDQDGYNYQAIGLGFLLKR